MDVIQPQLIWIGQRCYRKNHVSSFYGGKQENDEVQIISKNQEKPTGHYETDDYENDEGCTNSCIPVEKLEDGRFRTTMSIASDYFPKIIGRNGDNKKQIERETSTQILIPKRGQAGDLVITGFSHKGVTSAFVRISLVVSTARKRMPFTHFISVPLVAMNIKANFLQFKKDVLSLRRIGINDALFQNPEKLHLTIGTLVLLNNTDRERAKNALQNFQDRIPSIIGPEPIHIEIQGIEYMNDDPEQVDVLYGRIIDASNRLQRLADGIVESLEAEGLLDRQYERVKLHLTMMNSLFASKDDEETTRSTFNAKLILEKFKDYNFGSLLVEEIHLSERYSSSPSGYYMATSRISLNKKDF